MHYVLFVAGRVGYEALRKMIGKCEINHVFIESEHPHELVKYVDKCIEQCTDGNIPYTLDATNNDIERTLKEEIAGGKAIDYIMSFGYRRMIPLTVRDMARIAAIGTHFAPLPRYRGFAPLNWVLINGESETAVNIFLLEDRVDSGDILDREWVSIEYHDDICSLFDKCVTAFHTVLDRVIPKLESGSFTAAKQDEAQATYACARSPEDGMIDWNWSSRRIYDFVRAQTYPYPGAYSLWQGKKLIVWSCEEYDTPLYEGRIPGKVVSVLKDQGVVVLCGEGAVLLKDVQLMGGTSMTADRLTRSVRATLGCAFQGFGGLAWRE